MFMFTPPPKGSELYANQNAVQTVFVCLAAICVPWLLFVKPYILYRRQKQKLAKVITIFVLVSIYVDRRIQNP